MSHVWLINLKLVYCFIADQWKQAADKKSVGWNCALSLSLLITVKFEVELEIQDCLSLSNEFDMAVMRLTGEQKPGTPGIPSDYQ